MLHFAEILLCLSVFAMSVYSILRIMLQLLYVLFAQFKWRNNTGHKNTAMIFMTVISSAGSCKNEKRDK